jgi:ABC-type bacteriocin/lantibiotic exporter with double-glycine peptidase domain
MEMAECGAASLAMVLAYHGHHAPLPEVRQACGVSRDGATALGIVRAARVYGLDAEGVTLELRELAKLPTPAILHWSFRHFLVLERVHADGAVVVDPGGGRRVVDWKELGREFTGVALVFAPAEDFRPRAAAPPSFARYRGLLRQSIPSLIQLLLFSMMLQLLGLAFPIGTQVLFDHVILQRQEAWLWGLAIGLAAATAGRTLITITRNWIVQNLQQTFDIHLMGRFIGHLLHLPLTFFLQRTSGDLMQRVQSNILLRNLFTTGTITASLDVFMVLGFAALMLAYNRSLGALVIVLGFVRLIFTAALRRRNQSVMSAELVTSGRESATLLEALSRLEAIKASGAEGHMVRRYADRIGDRMNNAVARRRLEMAAGQVMLLLQGASMAAVLWLAGREVVAGRMTIGVFAAFLVLQGMFLAPLESLLRAVSNLQYLTSHLHRLDDVLESSVEVSGVVDPGRLSGAIELRAVSFRYAPGGSRVVQDINVRIAAGEQVALVGPIGAGKSTLARLLLGMHLPSSGSIRFDGRELRDLDLTLLRKQMGVVLQETYLFTDSIRANLAMSDPGVSMSAIESAAQIACIAQAIEKLPRAYDTILERGGTQFSGGERQRLALARALAHQPAILLLDEATSAVDLETERKIHQQLASLGVTRVVITHRMDSVRDADRILVLDGGRLAQQGTHAELASRDGLYRNLLLAADPDHA